MTCGTWGLFYYKEVHLSSLNKERKREEEKEEEGEGERKKKKEERDEREESECVCERESERERERERESVCFSSKVQGCRTWLWVVSALFTLGAVVLLGAEKE